MELDEYRKQVYGLMQRMCIDPDVSYADTVAFLAELENKAMTTLCAIAEPELVSGVVAIMAGHEGGQDEGC